MGRDVNYRNPYGSVPFPTAEDIPETLWSTEANLPVAWTGVAGGVDTAAWQSATFDMRPYLRSSQSQVRSGVPIWRQTAQLYIQVFGLATSGATTGLTLEYREFANTTFGQITTAGPARAVAPIGGGFPAQVGRDPLVRVLPRTNITSSLALGVDQPDSVILVFAPLGARRACPVRFWRVELLWTYQTNAGPALTFQAAMY